MYFCIDESIPFIFAPTPPMKWKIAVVGGAILPYEGRKIWLEQHKTISKGSNYTSEESVYQILDLLIECRVKGILRIVDVGHVSLQEANIFREKWINHQDIYADTLPQDMQKSLRSHLDNLKGEGQFNFSSQEFFKILTILDIISDFIQWLTHNLLEVRTIDLRKIKLIIDDQIKASLITLKSFVYYFLCMRSNQGLYICPPNSTRLLTRCIRKEGDQIFLDATKLFNELIVEDNANLDDKYPELKIADLLSNFSRRTLDGNFSVNVAKKLEKILVAVTPICFNNYSDIFVNLPSENQDAINMLLAIKPPWKDASPS